MDRTRRRFHPLTLLAAFLTIGLASAQAQESEPPALNPFGPNAPTVGHREDARHGVITLSDDSRVVGEIYLTRDARLEIEDEDQKRKRSVPLDAIDRADAVVLREWVEREWRFAENANDAKVYTGRSYPSREVNYKLTLRDGRTIRGPLSALVYVRAEGGKPQRFLLHKRDKGPVGSDLKSLIYVKSISFEDPKPKPEPTRP